MLRILIKKSFFQPKNDDRSLRSSYQMLLTVPSTNIVSHGGRAVSVAAPKLQHSLPFEIKTAETLNLFLSLLKTHLFRIAYFQPNTFISISIRLSTSIGTNTVLVKRNENINEEGRRSAFSNTAMKHHCPPQWYRSIDREI